MKWRKMICYFKQNKPNDLGKNLRLGLSKTEAYVHRHIDNHTVLTFMQTDRQTFTVLHRLMKYKQIFLQIVEHIDRLKNIYTDKQTNIHKYRNAIETFLQTNGQKLYKQTDKHQQIQ